MPRRAAAAGLYLSPWDRNNPVYGDSPRYNDLYCDQLTELADALRAARRSVVRRRERRRAERKEAGLRLAAGLGAGAAAAARSRSCSPTRARTSAGAGTSGVAGDPNWSTVDPAVVAYPGASGPGVTAALQHGIRDGTVWRPAEADTSIRPGWFHHPAEDERVRTVEQLVTCTSSPSVATRSCCSTCRRRADGVLHDTDVARLKGMRERLNAMFAADAAARKRVAWRRTGERTALAEVDFGRSEQIAIVRIEEDIATRAGGRAAHRVRIRRRRSGGELARGTTIGYARLHRIDTTGIRRLRVTIEEAAAPPAPVVIKAYRGGV